MTVTWRGLSAVYTRSERDIMRELPVKEQAFVHVLKAVTDGEISLAKEIPKTGEPREGHGAKVVAGTVEAHKAAEVGSPVYIDPDDIPFGETLDIPKRGGKRPVYALVWTWKSSKVCKTKTLATRKMRSWKKWYERQGWKVTNHETGYFAAKGDQRHAISLHEYDKETKERLK